jgi:hypothetical protein
VTFAEQPERSQSSGLGSREHSLVRERASALEKKSPEGNGQGEEVVRRSESVASSYRDGEEGDTAEPDVAEDMEAKSAASAMSEELSLLR